MLREFLIILPFGLILVATPFLALIAIYHAVTFYPTACVFWLTIATTLAVFYVIGRVVSWLPN